MARKNKILKEPESAVMVNWAIISHLKPHRLAYKINEKCFWNLYRLKNLGFTEAIPESGFALYNFFRNELKPEFYLIALKRDQQLLVKDLKNFDFLLQVRIHGVDVKWEASEVFNKLKEIEEIEGIYEINIDTVKNADVLYFDKQLDHLQLIEETEIIRKKKVN